MFTRRWIIPKDRCRLSWHNSRCGSSMPRSDCGLFGSNPSPPAKCCLSVCCECCLAVWLRPNAMLLIGLCVAEARVTAEPVRYSHRSKHQLKTCRNFFLGSGRSQGPRTTAFGRSAPHRAECHCAVVAVRCMPACACVAEPCLGAAECAECRTRCGATSLQRLVQCDIPKMPLRLLLELRRQSDEWCRAAQWHNERRAPQCSRVA